MHPGAVWRDLGDAGGDGGQLSGCEDEVIRCPGQGRDRQDPYSVLHESFDLAE